jgi:hypothetical protein
MGRDLDPAAMDPFLRDLMHGTQAWFREPQESVGTRGFSATQARKFHASQCGGIANMERAEDQKRSSSEPEFVRTGVRQNR